MAYRKFSLVVLDEFDKISDRYNLDYAINPTGLGYQLNLATIDTDVESYVTKMVQIKQDIKLNVLHLDGYKGSNNFDMWCAKHLEDDIALEYNDTTRTIYCGGKIVSKAKTELNNANVLETSITFKPLTPFFSIIRNKIRIQVSNEGKKYPFKYPYNYGMNIVENNEINNTYFKDVPLVLVINGAISNPTITLLDEDNNIYNEVKFSNFDLQEGQRLIVNGSRKKIYFDNGTGNLVDFYAFVDEDKDSYLRAEPLITSKVQINLEASDSGWLEGSWRQYLL